MKKTLSIILSVCMLLSMATTAFAAYGEHEHQLMKMANMNSHYEECQVCFELFNVGEHTFKDGKCTVCGHPELVNPFVDVPSDAWYHDEVVEAVDTGIINGKTATEFKPDDLLTYAETVKLAACMNQVYLNGEVTLTSGEPWYKPYADYCKANKITTKEYNYNENATRAGYMEIFANALPEKAFEEINNIPNGSILDVKSGATYAHYVYKMYRAGIVTGVDSEHNCNPDANIKRSEVATIISRMMDADKRVEFDMPGVAPEVQMPLETPEVTVKEPVTEITKDENEEPLVDNNKTSEEKEEVPEVQMPLETPEVTVKEPVTEITDVTVTPTKPVEDVEQPVADTPLTIHKQPEGSYGEEYGTKFELEVQVFGGKAPYSYQWYYYTGYRNNTAEIANGDYAKDAETAALVLSVEKENTLLGQKIYCVITDAEGNTVKTDAVKVYGAFSMPVDDWTLAAGRNTLIGKVSDGILKKGEKISVIRGGKVIAIGVAEDLQMFNKSMDETVKGDNVGIVFKKENGATPSSGDTVVKYQPSHVVDTSDIIN